MHLNIKYSIGIVVLLAIMLLCCYELWFVVERIFTLAYQRYRWVAVGIVSFFVLHHFVKKNMSFVKIFTHELTHTIVGMMLFRKIVSFQAQESEGVVWSSGSGRSFVFVSLAPYCFPVYTYLFLIVWSLIANRALVADGTLWALDIIIGITVAFHAICFKEQTGSYQTDINRYPLFFSYLYLYTFRLFNILIFLLCYLPARATGEPLKLWGTLGYLVKNVYRDLLSLFST